MRGNKMNDIVSQLRTQAYELDEQAWGDWAFKFNEAADEIERLRGDIQILKLQLAAKPTTA